VNGFQQLTPDRPFASVPYALSAASSVIAPGSINGLMLSPSLLSDLNGSISTAKMDPNLVRYFIPEISVNPAAVSIIQGTGTTLSVQANGKFLSYQWQKNGANLAGETNANLFLSNASANADDANYSVVISNDWGCITSPLARVTVATALPAITILGSASLVHEAATPMRVPPRWMPWAMICHLPSRLPLRILMSRMLEIRLSPTPSVMPVGIQTLLRVPLS
jgi:hypothetical protein